MLIMAAPIYHIHRLLKATGDNCEKLMKLLDDHQAIIYRAKGSLHNHQAWEGGYLQHVSDCMLIAQHIYSIEWEIQFSWSSVVLVLFLHDIEKPFMQDRMANNPLMQEWTKAERLMYRIEIIRQYEIILTAKELSALMFVEGEGMAYNNQERKMNELAALCHAADVLSARLWHNRCNPAGEPDSDC